MQPASRRPGRGAEQAAGTLPSGLAVIAVGLLVAALLGTIGAARAVAAAATYDLRGVPGTETLYGVACSTSTACVAVGRSSGSTGVVVPITAGVPGAPQAVSGTFTFYGVACASAAVCEAVGFNSAQDHGVVVTITNGIPGPVQSTETSSLFGVACPTATVCQAVGYDSSQQGSVVVSITDGSPGSPRPAGGGSLDSVACSSPTDCQAVGQNSAGQGVVVPITSGAPGSAHAVAGTFVLGAVACESTACEAVGANSIDGPGAVVPVATGTAGPVTALPDAQVLHGVACAGATTCEAVGVASSSTGLAVPITNGAPSAAQAVSGTSELKGVACPTPTTCEAVGSGSGQGVVVAITTPADSARTTSTAASCSPASVATGSPTVCTVVVTDSASGTRSTPTGTVSFVGDSHGSFSAGSCALVGRGPAQASCGVSYTPQAVDSGHHKVSVDYTGDHAPSHATAEITVSGQARVGLAPWNLELNPSFEASLSGWSAWQGSLARVAAPDAPHGGWVVQVSARAGASSTGYTLDDWPGAVSSSTAGMTYRASAWAKGTGASAGRPLELVVRESNDLGQVRAIRSAPVLLTTTAYQHLSVAYTATKSGDHIDMYLRRPPGMIETGDAFYADALTLASISPVNLEANPSFEANLSGWSAWRGNLARVAASDAPDGGWVAQVSTLPGAASYGYTLDDSPGAVSSSVAGMTYRASAWAKGNGVSAGRPLELVIRETGVTGKVGGVNSVPTTLTASSYQHLEVAYTARNSGDHINMYLRRPQGAIHTGDTFYADAFTLAAG